MIENLGNNQVFLGLVGAGALGTVGYLGKSFLLWCAKKLQRTFTSSISLNSKDSELFGDICEYILSLPSFSAIKTLYLEDAQKWRSPYSESEATTLLPSPGFYWGRKGLRPFYLDITTEPNQTGGITTTLKIGAVSWGKSFLEDKIKEIINLKKGENTVKVKVGNRINLRREKRSLDSVFIEGGVKEETVAAIDLFFNSKERYKACGAPWTFGLLLAGPPGTGKTSFLFALASHFGLEVRLIPSGIDVVEFNSFISESLSRTLIILEDADVSDVSVSREGDSVINLSTLLNNLDGIQSPEGCIFALTTNHFTKLDPAIVRAGRIDKICQLNYFSREFAEEISCKLSGMGLDSSYEGKKEIVPSELMTYINLR